MLPSADGIVPVSWLLERDLQAHRGWQRRRRIQHKQAARLAQDRCVLQQCGQPSAAAICPFPAALLRAS